MSNTIDKAFQNAINAGKINGALLCATDAKGDFVYSNAVGHRVLLSKEEKPQQLDDVLCIATVTQLVTTVAALQCVEDGLLSLKGDVAQVAPELSAKQVLLGFDEDGEGADKTKKPLLEPVTTPITLEMLLTHSAGQTFFFLDPNVTQWQKLSPTPANEAGCRVEEQFRHPLGFQPGAGWMFGPGLDWAGRIVERVTGGTLGEFVKKRIFGPLGITDAQFFPVASTRPDLRDRLVDLNPDDPDCLGSAIVGGGGFMNKNIQGDYGTHGLFMTAPDFVKVLHSLLANDGKLLKPETVDDMFADHLSKEAADKHRAAMEGPLGPFFRPDQDNVVPKTSYGLGGLLTLEDAADGWYAEKTLTWNGSMTLVWFMDRKSDLCGLCAIQPKQPITSSDRILWLKQVFSQDVYRKHAAWKEEHKAQ